VGGQTGAMATFALPSISNSISVFAYANLPLSTRRMAMACMPKQPAVVRAALAAQEFGNPRRPDLFLCDLVFGRSAEETLIHLGSLMAAGSVRRSGMAGCLIHQSHGRRGRDHSHRSAVAGSTRVARATGMPQPMTAETTTTAVMASTT